MYRNKKKIIIGGMMITVLLMVVVYAAFMTRLTINGTGNITSTWNIEITNIQSNITGTAYNISEPTYSGTNATFNAGLNKPGDKIEYSITVRNNGSIDAIINTVNIKTTGSYVIIFTVEGIQNQERLASEESKTFKIIVEFDTDATSIPSDTTKELIMDIECIQDDGQQLNPSDPNVDNTDTGLTLVNAILRDNTPQSDGSIDFSQISSDTNGKGLYYTSTNTEDNKTVYYFRGAVKNNYVSFAGYYWRIVRINEDGSIRLIYQKKIDSFGGLEDPIPPSIGGSRFNESEVVNDNAYVGYMYGTAGSDTYEATHANTNDSTIKTFIDSWYEENLINYEEYLADSGFCGDRSIANEPGLWNPPTFTFDTALGYGTNMTYYGAYNRLSNNKTPQFACPQSNDLYTTSSSNKGNKSLDYPIGLITADEVAYAGGVNDRTNTNYYLYEGNMSQASYWTMSPAYSFWIWGINGQVGFGDQLALASYNVRPVINLKTSIEITSGDGTTGNVYIIKES